MELKGKKFLVIGGAGLIGSHTVEALLKEEVEEIRIYDNFVRGTYENISAALKDKRVNVYNLGGDILHTDILNMAMQGIDGVFHFAALWLLHCFDFPQSAFEVNIRGTFNVIEACAKNKIKKLVFSSSASVYGEAIDEPMTEFHPYNNTTFYGASKIAGEHMLKSLYHRYKNTEKAFDYCGLRYFNVYGPRQDYMGAYVAVIMKILDRLDKNLSPVVYGDGSQAYDFIAVQDCAKANICAMKSDATDNFYNVCTGTKTSIKELAEMILEITGKQFPIEYNTQGVSFVKNRIGSTVKIQKDLSFFPDINLKEGLMKLIEWRSKHKYELEMRKSKAGAAE